MANGGSIIALIIIGVVIYFVFFKKGGSGGISLSSITGSGSGTGTNSTSGGTSGTAVSTSGGGTIYPAVSHAAIANPAGQNQQITYASSGAAATSHRVDVPFQNANVEATVYLAWPANCTGGGHPELAIKFWGPNHTDASCCYCYTSAVPNGGQLQLGFGGEGPHPSTTTLQKVATSIPFQAGKQYGIKGVIWKTTTGVHQETYYDDGSGWKLAGTYDRPTCGQNKTSPTIAANAEVEFRIDCANVTYSKTDVAAINPPGAAQAVFARARPATITTLEPPILEQDDCGCNPNDPNDCTSIRHKVVFGNL